MDSGQAEDHCVQSNDFQDYNNPHTAVADGLQQQRNATEPPHQREAKRQSADPEAGDRSLEQRRFLSRQVFKRAITKAAEQFEADESKAQESADMILEAMLWEDIKDLPRHDHHIVLAKHHLASCYFHMKNYALAEGFYQEVLKTRQAEKPPNPALILRTRQELVAALMRAAKQENEKNDFEREECLSVALSLIVDNINDAANSEVTDDIDDLWACCDALLDRAATETESRPQLLKTLVYTLVRIGVRMTINDLEGIKEIGTMAWDAYAVAEQDRKTGSEIYETIQSRVQSYQTFLEDRDSPDSCEVLRIGEELQAKWLSSLEKAEDEARKTEMPETTGTDTKRNDIKKNTDDQIEGERHAQTLDSVDPRLDRTGTGWSEHFEGGEYQTHRGLRIDYFHPEYNIELRDLAFSETPMDLDSIPSLLNADSGLSDIKGSEKWMAQFVRFRNNIISKQLDINMERIRVTVIDTGIDRTHPFVKKQGWEEFRQGPGRTQIALFKDFELDDTSETAIDEDGHGTFIAGIVLRLAPSAELSVARVTRSQDAMETDPQVACEDKVTAAILHAITEWKTDIISMSFGYQSIKTEALRDAIKKASHRDIILLGAAGNSGNARSNVSIPARLERVLKIFASDHLGNPSSFSPKGTLDETYCFSILGTNVVSIWPESQRQKATKDDGQIVDKHKDKGLWVAKSGSSFATPIAASLIAIIYQFYDANKADVSLQSSIRFKTLEAVKAVLLKMGMEPDRRYSYLNPTVGRDNFFKYQEERKLDRVTFFARQLSESILAVEG